MNASTLVQPAMPDLSSRTWNRLVLKSGALTLTLLPGLGGRLWDVALAGRSLLFQNPDLVGLPANPERLHEVPTRSPQFGFPLWGGEKTWIAPDTGWPDGAPHPVLDSGPYTISRRSSESVEMHSPLCRQSGLEVTRTVTINGPSSFSIHHRVRNRGAAPRLTGIWSVMMLDHPARIFVPKSGPGIKPVFGSNDGMVIPRAGGFVCRCDERREFKVGLSNPEGRTLIYCAASETWLLGLTDPPDRADQFAHGLPFEVFNSGDYGYCEAEWHSTCEMLEPGEDLTFLQSFRIWTGDRPPDNVIPALNEQEYLACMY